MFDLLFVISPVPRTGTRLARTKSVAHHFNLEHSTKSGIYVSLNKHLSN